MSIIIDDMKMPKSCMVCPFEHNGDCYGGKPKRIMDIEDFKGSRHPDCPLIENEPIKYYNTGSYKMTVTDFPTVEYAPIKHGRWEQIVHPWYECSECGERTAVVNLNGEVVWNYCPNCGAKMSTDGMDCLDWLKQEV